MLLNYLTDISSHLPNTKFPSRVYKKGYLFFKTSSLLNKAFFVLSAARNLPLCKNVSLLCRNVIYFPPFESKKGGRKEEEQEREEKEKEE